MSDFVMQIGADLDLSKVQEQLDSIKKQKVTTLVGELGREMCVNPHTGKWYTVGDNGAEFVNIPQGAIVFNHVQTEELLSKQLNDGVEAGTIVENSQEWLDMQTKIKEAQNAVSDYDTQIEELKQSQIGVYYEEQFDRAAEKVDRFRDKLDGLKSLISDDMKIDKNTGLLTESGALSITLDVDDINASTENLKTYISCLLI